jgi:hypothetical protein
VDQPWLNKKKKEAIVCELLLLTKISRHIDKCVVANTQFLEKIKEERERDQSRYD